MEILCPLLAQKSLIQHRNFCLGNDHSEVRLCENSTRVKCGLKISKKRAVEWPALRY